MAVERNQGRMEEPVSKVLDAIPDDARVLIIEELERRNPTLLAELRTADKPTNEQSDGVVLGVLTSALSANYGPGHTPNKYGLAVERAIDAYLEVWPIYR
jgi:hypothetical protein